MIQKIKSTNLGLMKFKKMNFTKSKKGTTMQVTKKIIGSVVLSTILLTSSNAGSVGGFGGATEATQLLNNAQLANQYAKQVEQYVTQLNQYQIQLRQFVQQVNTDAMILKNIGELPKQQWDQFTKSVLGMKQIMQNTQGMSYVASNYNDVFKQLYKPYETLISGELNPSQIYKDLSKSTNQTVNDALKQLHLQATDMDSDAETLRNLERLSQSAQGQTGAIQAANAIAINQIQTLRKLQQTMMTQANMMAQTMAAKQMEKDTSDAYVKKWTGSFNTNKPTKNMNADSMLE